MAKKIVVLNGSPRKNGNTAALIDKFTAGAQSAGHDVTRFNIAEMDISPCIGCLRGGKDKRSPCTQKDDMDKIYPAYEDTDVIVLASPLYFWSFTAQLKTVIDRIFAVAEANNYHSPHKDCIMLIAAGDNSKSNFQPMIDYYKSLLQNIGWTDAGMLLAGGVNEIGDIAGKPVLEDARRLGAAIKG